MLRGGVRAKLSRSQSGSGPGGADMRGFGEIAERLRRSTVQVFHGTGEAADRVWSGARTG